MSKLGLVTFTLTLTDSQDSQQPTTLRLRSSSEWPTASVAISSVFASSSPVLRHRLNHRRLFNHCRPFNLRDRFKSYSAVHRHRLNQWPNFTSRSVKIPRDQLRKHHVLSESTD